MATYKAIANGNADTLSIWETWDGSAWVAASILPGESDDVYTNGFIVTVTTSQSYKSWNRSSVDAPLSITQGGQFQIDGVNDILISGDIYGTNVSQTTGSPLSACVNRLATHTGKLSIIGNQNGGSGAAYGFYNNSTFEFTSIIGNQNGGSGHVSHGFFNNAACTFTSIVGNQNGGIGTNAYGFVTIAACTFTSITGNQNGGIGTNAYGFVTEAACIFTSIVGNQNGGIGTNAYGFYNAIANLNIPFQGNAYASNVAAAIHNTQATTTIIYTGNIYNNLGLMAIYSARLFLNVTPTTVWEFSDFGGNSQYLYGAGVNTGHPIEADVKKDTVYGPNDEFTGTLVQPPFTIADFIAALKADDLGKRMGKCATTEELDSTVAAFNT